MPSGLVINGVKDTLAAALQILESSQEEVVWLIPASINSLSVGYDFPERVQAFVQRGGATRGILNVLPENVAEVQLFLDAGENIRHSTDVHELFMFIGDKKKSISTINIGVTEFTLDTPGSAFWSEDPAYAEYLLTSFERAWAKAIPAKQRFQELGKEIEHP